MAAILIVVFWLVYWSFVFKMKNPIKQLTLLVVGLVAPGGAEILAIYISLYLVSRLFFGNKNVNHST